MPKTIHSRRNPLTEQELVAYRKNLITASKLRKQFLAANPDFRYLRVFTEARAKGKCRTKFWGVSSLNQQKFATWLTTQQGSGLYRNCKIDFINPGTEAYAWVLKGVAVTIG